MNSTEAERLALGIYETICATGHDRPISGQSREQLLRALDDWRANNPGLQALRQAAPEVQICFLQHSLEWLQAESQVNGNLGVSSAMAEAIRLALQLVPKPLPSGLVSHLLDAYGQAWASMVQIYFPFELLLSLLTRDEVTDQIRAELRNRMLYYAPSATGKMDERTERIRKRIIELIHLEGEKQFDPGRGPWSQIVFDELKAKDEITRVGWESLLEHCRSLEAAIRGVRWAKTACELTTALGEAEVTAAMLQWLALGPTPGQPSAACSPIEDSAYQKGVIWCLGAGKAGEVAVAIADFGLACLRKIPAIGAVSQKVGFACVQALGTMDCGEAVAQLTRLRAKVKYSVAQRLIEKSLRQAAERSGMSVADLEDISVGSYGLNAHGVRETTMGDAKATVQLSAEGKVSVAWQGENGIEFKSPPAQFKKAHAIEIRSISSSVKDLEEAYSAQRVRLESLFAAPRSMPVAHWHKYYLEHPLLGCLGRRLIWVFSNRQGWERAGIWAEGEARDSLSEPINLSAAETARLWHPLSCDRAEVQRWRDYVYKAGIRQPFRQAFREFYEVTEDECQTKIYSNRFAGIWMRQHQLASLCRARGWDYRLMSANFDGANVPTKKLAPWNMHAEFYVDIPSDRDISLLQSALGEQSGAGINLFVGSDQVRFYRDRKEIAIGEVPAIVYSEVIRDVDLFTSVCAVGDDETWSDQGERGTGVLSNRFTLESISAIIALRADMLARVLPHTTIADRCQLVKAALHVRGQLGNYRITLGWGMTAFITESRMRWLKIPQKLLDSVPLDLAAIPIDLDFRTEQILRKALLLADDWKIDSPDLVRQLMPE